MIRDDLSDRLIHLTKGGSKDAASTLFKIISERSLLGGDGKIKGGFRCVCFSEAPISKLATILANRSPHGMRYQPFGVMVEKAWLFGQGGRPVIYQPRDEFDLLPDGLKFRHVTYNPILEKPIDFSWEREWRIRADELPLDTNCTTIVVPNRDWAGYIIEHYSVRSFRFAWITNRIPLRTSDQRPVWHLVVLEDLGVPILSIDPPD